MTKRNVTMNGDSFTIHGMKLAVGDLAPEFKLLDNDLKIETLKDFGDNVKLLSIVPSLDTGVCALQARRFNEEISLLDRVVGITVSVDLPFAQKNGGKMLVLMRRSS